MTIDYICAIASKVVYQTTEIGVREGLSALLQDWDFYHRKERINNDGYLGLAIKNDINRTVVIAHRGTVTALLPHLYNDGFIALGHRPPIFTEAKNFSEEVRRLVIRDFPGYTVIETGHSLGATLSELVIADPEIIRLNQQINQQSPRAINFDSPGCVDILDREGIEWRYLNITTYFAAPDGVNVCSSRRVGNLIRVYVDHVDRNNTITPAVELTSAGFGKFLKAIVGESWVTQIFPQLGLGLAVNSVVGYYLNRQHSMELILQTFDTQLGIPRLQRKVSKWPTLTDFFSWMSAGAIQDLNNFLSAYAKIYRPDLAGYNQKCEQRLSTMSNYCVDEFLFPQLPNQQNFSAQFCIRVLDTFDNFHRDLSLLPLRTQLENLLNYHEYPLSQEELNAMNQQDKQRRTNQRTQQSRAIVYANAKVGQTAITGAMLPTAGAAGGAGIAVYNMGAVAAAEKILTTVGYSSVAAGKLVAGWSSTTLTTGVVVSGAATGLIAGFVVIGGCYWILTEMKSKEAREAANRKYQELKNEWHTEFANNSVEENKFIINIVDYVLAANEQAILPEMKCYLLNEVLAEVAPNNIWTQRVQARLALADTSSSAKLNLIKTLREQIENEQRAQPFVPPVIDGQSVIIGKKIGDGATAEVYQARWQNHQSLAYKRLRTATIGNLRALQSEVEILRNMTSPHVVGFYGMHDTNGSYGFLMEYMALGSLRNLLDRKREENAFLTWPQRIDLMEHIVQGLIYLHERNIIHRDLRATNVLINQKANGAYQAKLADFGLANSAHQQNSSTNSRGQTLPFWLDPVVAMGQQPNFASDIYSFAVLSWEIVTHEHPFANDERTPTAISINIVMVENRADIQPIPPECPQPIAAMITQCWAREPNQRLPLQPNPQIQAPPPNVLGYLRAARNS